eukprot:2542906-Rhodomonas_salina.1
MAPPVSGPSERDFEQSLDNDSDSLADQKLYKYKNILRKAKDLIDKAKERHGFDSEECSATMP